MGLAAVVLAVLIAQIAVGGSSDEGKIASLQRQVNDNERQINALKAQLGASAESFKAKSRRGRRGPPGPSGAPGQQGIQGPPGPPGSPPACQGNDANDVMVSAGAVCIDRYEVSVWDTPTGNGTQYGTTSDDYPCNDNGQDCIGANAIYARSVAGVTPSTFITWFQAQQALANSGKRLPSSAEWQQAVAGTPDSTACNVNTGSVANTGASSGCISNWGANDMVGNVSEWVADWVASGTANPGWGPFSDDLMGLSGASTTALGPGAVVRGGVYTGGTNGGPFSIAANGQPWISFTGFVGFRGAR